MPQSYKLLLWGITPTVLVAITGAIALVVNLVLNTDIFFTIYMYTTLAMLVIGPFALMYWTAIYIEHTNPEGGFGIRIVTWLGITLINTVLIFGGCVFMIVPIL